MLGTICERCGKPTNDYTPECFECMTRNDWKP